MVASPETSPLKFLEFGVAMLPAGGTPITWESRSREAVVYLVGGFCEVTVTGSGGTLTGVLDSRASFFGGPPSAVFVPAGSRLGLRSPKIDTRLAFFAAPPADDRRPRLIGSNDVGARTTGRDNWSRRVVSVVDEHIASRLLVGETINPPGNWSSYPPHKHDAAVPDREVPMEEIYHYLVDRPSGFGLQMVYTPADAREPFEHTYRVRDGDTVVIPRGYHPVVAASGYQLAYVWAISGERVVYRAWSDEPAHAWLNRP
jgi:5-deoxy-glucuronate isomerase